MSAEEIVPGVVTPDTSENEENTNTTPSFREINLGRIVGDSSYELAVKHGKFEGSEEEYVEKEQKVYDDMVKFCDDMKLELSGLVPLPQRVSSRMNDFGEVDLMDIDRLMELFSEDDNYHKTDDGKLLDKWEWCVVIGCHYIWIDDFMDFIKYYNLYDIFDIKAPKEENKEQVKLNKPFKIKIK